MAYEINIIKDVPYRDGGKTEGPDSRTLDLYVPQGKENFPLLFFLHGGGFIHYDWTKDSYADYCRTVAGEGIAVAAANYRLYPEYKGMPKEINKAFCEDPDGVFHGFLDDAAAALAFARENLGKYGPFSGDVFLGGHSAGAWLGMMLLFNGTYLLSHGVDPSELAGCIFASGQPTSHFSVLYARGMDPRLTLIDDAAPMYYLKSLKVPQLVTMAERDIRGRALQTQLYLDTLRTIGYEGDVEYVEYKGRTHDNCIVPDAEAPDSPCALHDDTVRFIKKYGV